MVGTRKRKSTDDFDIDLVAAENDPKLKSLIKSLNIDAEPALKGEAVEDKKSANVKVYHWRGSVFEVTPDTPEEWLQKEPERYKKKRRTESTEAAPKSDSDSKKSSDDHQGKSSHHVKSNTKSTTSQKATLTDKSTSNQTPTVTDKSTPSKKRPFGVDGANDASEDVAEEPPAKRARRGSDKYAINYSRPKDLSDFTPGRRKARSEREERARKRSSVPEKKPKDRAASSRMYDYTRVGGHDTISCIEAARKTAEEKGYTVEPYSYHYLRHRNLKIKSRTSGMTLDCLKMGYELNKKGEEVDRLRQCVAEWRDKRGKKRKFTDEQEQEAPANAAKKFRFDPPAHLQSPLQHRPINAAQATPPFTNPALITNLPTPPSAETTEHSDVEPVTEHTERHDSGAELVTATSIAPVKSTQPTTDLPTTNKGGQPLRWSLPKAITEVGRAEEAINRSRMTGESKSARRRRIKREFKIVENWPIVNGGPGQSEEQEDATAAGADDEAATAEREDVEEDGNVEDQSSQDNEEGDEEQEGGEEGDEDEEEQEEQEEERGEEQEQVHTPSSTEGSSSPIYSSNESGERRSSRVEKIKTQVCRDWKKGHCQRGSRCTYMHQSS